MKKKILSIVLAALVLILTACGTAAKPELWKNAAYQADTELGTGAVSFKTEVVADGKTVVFQIHTDREILGDALTDNGLIAGEEGPYGLYVKKVNGITADFDQDGSYWMLYINGEMAMNGVDGTPVEEGSVYKLERTK